MNQLEESILETINKTGFVNELKVFSFLSKKKLFVEHGSTYEDLDEKKSREMDIVATKYVFYTDVNLIIEFEHVIELKKSSDSWIVFSSSSFFGHNPGWSLLWKAANVSEWEKDDSGLLGGGYYRNIFYKRDNLFHNYPRAKLKRVGKAFYETSTNKGKEKSIQKIYSSLLSTCKAAYYFNSAFSNSDVEFKKDLEQQVRLKVTIPIVIFDGNLFEVFYSDENNISVQQINYIPIELNYSSPNYKSGKLDCAFFPEMVTFEYFESFFNELEIWQNFFSQSVYEEVYSRRIF